MSEQARHLLEVDDLEVHFPTADGLVRAVDGLTFSLEPGRTLGIVGESGSGKSVTSQAILGLHRGTPAKVSGRIRFDGVELLDLPIKDLRRLRGNDISMIFQDPLSALHPYYSVGKQIAEAYRVHHSVSRRQALARAEEMLELVGIPNAGRRVHEYPHQFSGGMRQRAMIAMALVNDPRLLIADEPTTALDVTVQAQILELMKKLQREFGSAIIIITHDLGVVADIADDVLVMYAGHAVEQGAVNEVFYQPDMPYTWGLLSSMPRIGSPRGQRLATIAGSPPSLIRPPSGCRFHPRCAYRGLVEGDACVTTPPRLVAGGADHRARCHLEPGARERVRLQLSTIDSVGER
ncbi:ABC transporter ATP-binding protein [Paractinoplanes maris]|uniref:ABC transporter ATP-binding protein n=1 Tax=Paractinoplanes maris TaxID=1734446 RepID=UPI002021B906|nr:ABC transporter ATP-binding protein [Actinoplanes maris]